MGEDTDLRRAFDTAYNETYEKTKGSHAEKADAAHAAGNKAHKEVLKNMKPLKYKGMKEAKSPEEHGKAVRKTSSQKFADQSMETGYRPEGMSGSEDLFSHMFPTRLTGHEGHHSERGLVAGQAAHRLRRARSIRHKPTGIKRVGKAAQRAVRRVKRVVGR